MSPKSGGNRRTPEAEMVRPELILFGDSITEQSFRLDGRGAALADAYSRKADIVVRGSGGYTTRWALFLINHIFPVVLPTTSRCCNHLFWCKRRCPSEEY